MTNVPPSADDRGKVLGLINLAVTLPQATAALAAFVLLEGFGFCFRSLFFTAVICFACAALALGGIRRVR